MPQPNTFARSKDDVLQALSFYFGQPVSPEKLKDYNEHHAATCTRLSQPTANDLRTPPLTPYRLFYSCATADHFPGTRATTLTRITPKSSSETLRVQ